LAGYFSDDEVDQLDREISHIFSLFWMLIHRKLPSEVSDDIISWINSKKGRKVLKMNKEVFQGLVDPVTTLTLEIPIAGNLFTFDEAEHAPPSGVMAANYSRYLFFYIPLFNTH